MKKTVLVSVLVVLALGLVAFTDGTSASSVDIVEQYLAAERDPLRLMRVVAMSSTPAGSLVEVGAWSKNHDACKAGHKCPIQGAECCSGGEFCCMYGCLNDVTPLQCKPNDYASSLKAARSKISEEADKKEKRELEQFNKEKAHKSKSKELETKTRSEEKRKQLATAREAQLKRRRGKKEAQTKRAQGKESAHKSRMEEAQKREETEKQSQRKLPLKNRMEPYDRGYRHPKYTVLKQKGIQGGLCVLSGVMVGPNQKTIVASLPPSCRCEERLVFPVSIARTKTARYDVLSNGDLQWVGGAFLDGGNSGHWIPLDGISFLVAGSVQNRVPLNDPWSPYGRAGYQGPRFAVDDDGLVVISGLVRTRDWRASSMSNPVFTMGPEARPNARLVFRVSHHEFSHRLDILPNGEAHLIVGKKRHPWISLSGLIFHTKQGEPLPLTNGWRAYGEGFRSPSVVKTGTLCVLSGMAKPFSGWRSHVATLSEACRPAQRLIFSLNAHESTQRIDIFPDGSVRWIDGKKTWVSFDGIRFVVP